MQWWKREKGEKTAWVVQNDIFLYTMTLFLDVSRYRIKKHWTQREWEWTRKCADKNIFHLRCFLFFRIPWIHNDHKLTFISYGFFSYELKYGVWEFFVQWGCRRQRYFVHLTYLEQVDVYVWMFRICKA